MLQKYLRIKKRMRTFATVIKTKLIMRQPIFISSQCNYDYESYLEYCELNDFIAGTEDSMEYWEYVYDMQKNDIENALIHFDNNTDPNAKVMITGELGLWSGRKTIMPVVVESERIYNHQVGFAVYSSALTRAVEKCMDDMDSADCFYDDEEGCVVVEAHHHDGCNVFHIRKINDFGMSAMEDADDKDEDYNPTTEWFDKFTEVEVY